MSTLDLRGNDPLPRFRSTADGDLKQTFTTQVLVPEGFLLVLYSDVDIYLFNNVLPGDPPAVETERIFVPASLLVAGYPVPTGKTIGSIGGATVCVAAANTDGKLSAMLSLKGT